MDWRLTRQDRQERLLWWALATGAAMIAGVAVRQLMLQGYRLTRGKKLRNSLASRDTDWLETLLWAAVSGFLVAAGRVVAQQLMAGAWEKRTGRRPPGL